MRTTRSVLAPMLAVALVLIGLAPVAPTVSAQGTKKVIRFGVNRAAENLDPVTQDANPDIWAFTQIYQQLARVNVKGDGFEPDLAERWTTSADGRKPPARAHPIHRLPQHRVERRAVVCQRAEVRDMRA